MKKTVMLVFLLSVLVSCGDNSSKIDNWEICDSEPCPTWKNPGDSVHKKGFPAAYQLKTVLQPGSREISFITNSTKLSVSDQNGTLYTQNFPTETSMLHIIPLNADSRQLVLSVSQENFNPYNIHNYSYTGPDSSRKLIQGCIHLYFTGGFLALIGIYAFALSLRSGQKEVMTFGLFSFFAGVNAFANSPLSSFIWFEHNYSLVLDIRSVSFYGGNAFLFLFMEKMLGSGPGRFLKRFNILLAVLSIVFLAITLVYPDLNVSLNIIYLPVTLVGGIALLAWLFHLAVIKKNMEARIIFSGGLFLIFLQIGVYLYYLGTLPWLISFDWAIFFFILSLGILLVRRSWLLKVRLADVARELDDKNRELVKSAAQKEKLAVMEKEMEMANRIQSSILPDYQPSVKNMETAVQYIPAESVGGDFFDFFEKEDKLGVLITDVSGHGFSSALIASMVKVCLHASERYWNQPGEMLGEIGMMLQDKLKHNFLSACYALIDPVNNKLVLANAGHPPVYIHKKDTSDIRSCNSPGKIIGFHLQKEYQAEEFSLAKGDRIIFLTDGILECENDRNEMYEEKQLMTFIIKNSELGAEAFSKALIQDLKKWTRQNSFMDDVTLVVTDIL